MLLIQLFCKDKRPQFMFLRYLAIVAALASEADFVFCPESPPPEDWQTRLCSKLEQVFLDNLGEQ